PVDAGRPGEHALEMIAPQADAVAEERLASRGWRALGRVFRIHSRGRENWRPRVVPAPGAIHGLSDSGPARRARVVLPLGLFLHHRAALVRALLLALHLHPAGALALVLAGAGMAAIRGGALALALARVD